MIFNTEEYFNKIYDILVNLGGAPENERIPFVYEHLREDYPCNEWRFCGKLGFGGKYRSMRNSVDCYQEDETNERVELIKQMNIELAKAKRPLIYLDLDGVCADFNTEIMKVHPTIFEHEDGDYRSQVIDEIVEADVNIFQRLQPMPGALEAIEYLKEHFDIYFLSTAMWNVPESFTDKRLWLEKHFGDFAKKRLILTHRKDLNIGHFLIDDRLKNGAAEFRGKHIHFGVDPFSDWKTVVAYLKNFVNVNI